MKKLFKTIFIIVIVSIAILACVFGYLIHVGKQSFDEAIAKKPLDEMVSEIQSKENYVSLSELPQEYLDAIIAVEDRRFYTHKGIDMISIGRAIYKNISQKALVEGGSTITQQLAKNTYFSQSKDFKRKIAEMFMAKEYEKQLDKNTILELYINTMYFGNGYYSVKEATHGYFGKEPSEMNLYDSTILAGIPNAPSVYAPTKNVNLTVQRQAQVIYKMLKYGYITGEQARTLLDTPYPYHSNLTD